MSDFDTGADVVVVGAGNAGLCAALSAAQNGASVMVLDRADSMYRGGNTAFTAGAMRVAYGGVEDIVSLVPGLSETELRNTDFGSYPVASFYDDMADVTHYRTDPDLAYKLASESLATLTWMRDSGVPFLPIYGRQAYQIDGRFKFWGGLTLEVAGGGPEIIQHLSRACANSAVKIVHGVRALELITTPASVAGLIVRKGDSVQQVGAKAVVLAAGGFQSSAEWRTRYLGPGWDLAKVRGTRYNTGDGIRMALEIGASSSGNWSGCHAVAWDSNAPEFGDPQIGDHFQKHSYPLGIMVNALGERFVDEGANFRNYTYAKYGGDILRQPGHVAWQIFDSKVDRYLRDEYRIREVTKFTADTIEQLAEKIPTLDAGALVRTVLEYNDAVLDEPEWNPNVLDGRRTVGLPIDKTNWALRIDEGPFVAYEVTCGITFTFGGLRVDTDGKVLNDDGAPIPGLFAAGELVGGLFYFNYPGGSGLTAGSVFGRTAGMSAAALARRDR